MAEKAKKKWEHEICPTCKKEGSGLHEKWVLNEQKKRYYPYYYFAHSVNGKVEWCYVRKKKALAIIASKKLRDKYHMTVAIASKVVK